MKKYFLLISFSLVVFSLYTQDLNFTSHTTVSSGNDGFGRPRVVLINL